MTFIHTLLAVSFCVTKSPLANDNRAVARTLIGGGGGGGCLFIYSCSARLVSFQIDKFEFVFKRN